MTGAHRPDGSGRTGPGADVGTDPRDDAELLAAHVAGDAGAFAELVRRHGSRLWGLAWRTLGNREDAADALQDGLLNAHRSAASFRGDSAVVTWLHRIVVNACLDRVRRSASRPSQAAEPDALELLASYSENHREPEVGDGVAVRLDVERALATLPADQRAALVLVDVLGHDVATAAAILGCAPGTIKSRCSRGRARLAPQLEHLRNRSGGASVLPGDAPTGDPVLLPPPPTSEGGDPA